jgi:hypothetical protein
VGTVTLDIGFAGIGLLIVIALAFGLIAQVVVGAGTRWMWLVASAAWFIGGLFASEVVWGNATSDELQPVIDGLAFDESLLGGLIAGIVAVVATRLVLRGRDDRPRVTGPRHQGAIRRP